MAAGAPPEFPSGFINAKPFTSQEHIVLELMEWERLRSELKKDGEEQSDRSCMDSIMKKAKGVKRLYDAIEIKRVASETELSVGFVVDYIRKVGESYIAERGDGGAIAAPVAFSRYPAPVPPSPQLAPAA